MEQITNLLLTELKKRKIKLTKQEIEKLIEIPPTQELGDYAFPCFTLSKILKKNPVEIAKELSKIKTPKGIQEIKQDGAYLNFFIDKTQLAEEVIKKVLTKKQNYGKNQQSNKTIMIEFSSPNTQKAFHVGHIRGTSLGESLSRVFEFCGQKVIKANYSGDTGMHIAKWIWCYNKYHKNETPKDDEEWIASIYTEAAKKSEKFQNEINQINKKIEDKSDKEINKLWKKTRELSIKSWIKIYKELGAKFDIHYFESEVEKRGKKIAKNLLKQKIAKKSQGATIMDLEKYNLGIWVLLRKDGTVLYSAKDLALAEKKLKQKAEEYLTLTAEEQNLHFQQILKTLELMKLKNHKKFSYIPFALIRLPTGKMSSRSGENILYSQFMKETTEFAKKGIKKRNPKISQKELKERATKIAISAIKYSILKQNPSKVITFKKEEALNFEGNTGPYLLYSYARASSILKKTTAPEKFKINKINQQETKLIKQISQFPEIVLKTHKTRNPSIIANYSYKLCQIFNEFYHSCPVINSKNETFRINLVKAFKQTLKNSLYLLSIETLEKM